MKVYTKGFSQNSMFAVYTAVCFADKVAGVWQGGSGLAKTAFSPIVPGAQAQCTLSNALADGGTSQCCKQHFCTECKFGHCTHKHVHQQNLNVRLLIV